jgi:CO/xanthine dehydrogenase Mo-binding subunit
VGKPVARIEGAEKVSGKTLYTADVRIGGMLYGKILRSPYPHARIKSIDISRALHVPGVHAVLTGKDLEGVLWGKTICDMPVLCFDKVRFVGDRVAAVAAESVDSAEQAIREIVVEYEELPTVFDPVEAIKSEAPRVHEDVAAYQMEDPTTKNSYGSPRAFLMSDVPNGMVRMQWGKGDLDQGFRDAELILEHTFRIPAQHQGYLEPHAAIVHIDGDSRIQVWTSAKNPFGVRSQLAQVCGVSEDLIRVNVVNIGGDFGGKGDILDVTIAYFLAQRTGRPVKIVMTYLEELLAANPSPSVVVCIRSGLSHDGRIVARHIKQVYACGAYAAFLPTGRLTQGGFAGGVYKVDHYGFEVVQVYTNTVPAGYFRGPATLATSFAVECHTDLCASAVGMNAVQFRMANLLRNGEEDGVGLRPREVCFREALQAVLGAVGWVDDKPDGTLGRGVAIFGRHHGGDRSGAILTAERDGSFVLVSPTIDQGTGTHTVLAQIVAEEMRVQLGRVRVEVADTDSAPLDDGVRACRVTQAAGQAVLKACHEMRELLSAQAAEKLGCPTEELEFGDGVFWDSQNTAQRIEICSLLDDARGPQPLSVRADVDLGNPADSIYATATAAEVEVDLQTGQMHVRRLAAAVDAGTVLNPLTHQGQLDGGIVMGFGQSTMEELAMDTDRGQVTNVHLGDYKLPCAADIPHFTSVLLDTPGGLAPYGGKPAGEATNITPPAAIANALADAAGVRLFELPITAERVYYALQEDAHDPDRSASKRARA